MSWSASPYLRNSGFQAFGGLSGVGVKPDDLMAQGRHPHRVGGTEIAGANPLHRKAQG